MTLYSSFIARTDYVGTALTAGIRVGLVLLLWMPLVVTPDTLFPSFVGKGLYARGLIEIVTAVWLLALLWTPALRPHRSLVVLAFGLYVAISVLSAASGVSFNRSLWGTYGRMMGVWDLFHWFLLVMVASAVLRSAWEWRSFINWNLAVALALSALALAQAAGVFLGGYLVSQCRVDATLGNPTYLAVGLMVTSLLAVGLLAQSFLRREGRELAPADPVSWPNQEETAGSDGRALLGWRIFWVMVAALGILVIFQTGTRAALIGLAGGAVIMPIALAIWGNRKALWPVALAAGGTVLAIGVLFTLQHVVGLHIDPDCERQATSSRLLYDTAPEKSSIAQRILSVEAGASAFLDRPLLGWGPENYEPAFERFVDVSYFNHSFHFFDQAHNKPVEELATKGVLGTLAYFGLWAAVVWVVVRRRRRPGAEVLAYAVLGALAAYFIQNLFFFDTTATMLQLALLIAWVASQERRPEADQPASAAVNGVDGEPSGVQEPGRSPVRTSASIPVSMWLRGAATVAILALAGLSIYYLNYRPYAAASTIIEAMSDQRPVAERLALAERSFDTFPQLANEPRAIFFRQLVWQWEGLTEAERGQAVQLLTREVPRGLDAEPQNVHLLISAVLVLRQVPDTQNVVDIMLARLKELAPVRLQTHVLLAENELFKGNYEEALRIAGEYEAQVPSAEQHFRALKRVARERLETQRE